MSELYNSNSIDYGSITAALVRGVTTLGTYVFESVTIERGSNVINRGDELNTDNGWAMTEPLSTPGSAVVQIPTNPRVPGGAKTPKPGDYFEYTFDNEIGEERFVITSVSAPREQNGYTKVNVNLLRDSFAA